MLRSTSSQDKETVKRPKRKLWIIFDAQAEARRVENNDSS